MITTLTLFFFNRVSTDPVSSYLNLNFPSSNWSWLGIIQIRWFLWFMVIRKLLSNTLADTRDQQVRLALILEYFDFEYPSA